MIAPARLAALRVLRSVHAGRSDLAQAQSRVRETLPDPRDRALAMEIALGTLRWRGALDATIEQVSARPLPRVDAEVLDVLRLSAYQLLHLRVPPHAVVHDAVALTTRIGKRSAGPFVNAVLRAVAHDPPRFALPGRPPDARPEREAALAYLSVTCSHPRWLAERWLDRLGFEAAERWMRFDNTPPPVTLRIDPRAGSIDEVTDALARHGVVTRPGRHARRARLVTAGRLAALPSDVRSRVWVQDEASQLVGELVAATRGDRLLDLCAAPGGKTLVVATESGDTGLVVAGDVRSRRVRVLADRVRRAGLRSTYVVRLDAAAPPCAPVFDSVLLDAPCSGLGTLRRDPDIRWRRTAADLPSLALDQHRLLRGAAASVRPGGTVIYATCSSEPEENHLVVERFLTGHPRFRLERPAVPHLEPFVDGDGFFQTRPDRDGLEAFFAALLRRTIP